MRAEPSYHEMSHGESFLDVATQWFGRPSFFVLDEPEAGLSFVSQLGLVAAILDGVAAGGQFVVATHSPVLMAVPGAALLEVGPDGIVPRSYDELDVVQLWASFLDDPAVPPPPRGGRRRRGRPHRLRADHQPEPPPVTLSGRVRSAGARPLQRFRAWSRSQPKRVRRRVLRRRRRGSIVRHRSEPGRRREAA